MNAPSIRVVVAAAMLVAATVAGAAPAARNRVYDCGNFRLTVSTTARTANDHPAWIDRDQVIWRADGYLYRLDRRTSLYKRYAQWGGKTYEQFETVRQAPDDERRALFTVAPRVIQGREWVERIDGRCTPAR